MISTKKKIYKYLDSYKKIPKHKKGKKVPNELFVIPKLKNYDFLIKFNYNKKQIKEILKKYNQPVSGNKEIIINRCYNFLKLSYFSIIIQKYFRKFLCKEYIRISGPAVKKRDLCINKTDFLSLDNISTIQLKNFFSYRDEDNFIYGFDFCSIYNLVLKENPTKNPYNRKKLPGDILKKIDKKIRISKILGFKIKTDINNIKELDSEKEFRFKTLAIFHKIDELGNYSNLEWFMSLNKQKLIRFTKELLDIWQYRAQLSIETKKKIFPPFGNPFARIRVEYLINKDRKKIRKIILFLIENLITKGVDKQSKCLGAFYVLGALTLVNNDAALALPWLYESVRYTAPPIHI